MDFALSPEQEAIREGVSGVCARFDDAYWLKRQAHYQRAIRIAFIAA